MLARVVGTNMELRIAGEIRPMHPRMIAILQT